MNRYREALVWAGVIMAIALLDFDTGVATALIGGVTIVALNSLYRRDRATCGSCRAGRS
ncbi:hypothetical protein U4960_00700 [Altererythrobacter sp. H2]|uniref:hypothetical protein n=1 Tax=Altererythrobacter sp. H2 TaxID=3108391 RepID=UPI002B4C00EB|nr:hypothetical protein [Altererythrobacter sp. H2]WRK95882.1 hypothetical protein U4960_00700 [Altererythrobacter sp. H2]